MDTGLHELYIQTKVYFIPIHDIVRSFNSHEANVAFNSRTRGKSVRSWYDGSSDRSYMVVRLNYFRSSQYSTTGITKAVVCAILSVEWCI